MGMGGGTLFEKNALFENNAHSLWKTHLASFVVATQTHWTAVQNSLPTLHSFKNALTTLQSFYLQRNICYQHLCSIDIVYCCDFECLQKLLF